MEVRTYRARSIHEALQQVRGELGPQAAILHTRELRSGVWGWLRGGRQIEVTASTTVHVPSRFAAEPAPEPAAVPGLKTEPALRSTPPEAGPRGMPRADQEDNFRSRLRRGLAGPLHGRSIFDDLCGSSSPADSLGSQVEPPLPEAFFDVFMTLIDAEMEEELARSLLEQLRGELPGCELADAGQLIDRLGEMLQRQLQVTGPLQLTEGQRRIVALVGPTGVGKTTTIAKLAANYHLREGRRVGLITVDTYRIAAVEQLRTYADIIDLPMEVVSTPREMRQAVQRLEDLDLVLVDTAGRSPRDDLQIQELKSMLAEAQADEVHLVLSSVASARSLRQAAVRFARAGTTSLLLTKLDEANGLGNVLSLVRDCGLPISYVTNGQNVPEDISPADGRKLATAMLHSQTD